MQAHSDRPFCTRQVGGTVENGKPQAHNHQQTSLFMFWIKLSCFPSTLSLSPALVLTCTIASLPWLLKPVGCLRCFRLHFHLKEAEQEKEKWLLGLWRSVNNYIVYILVNDSFIFCHKNKRLLVILSFRILSPHSLFVHDFAFHPFFQKEVFLARTIKYHMFIFSLDLGWPTCEILH